MKEEEEASEQEEDDVEEPALKRRSLRLDGTGVSETPPLEEVVKELQEKKRQQKENKEKGGEGENEGRDAEEDRSHLPPEIAAGLPRGVTPRGAGYVAKYGVHNGCEYLGSFEDIDSAKEAYGLADAEFKQVHLATGLDPQIKSVASNYERFLSDYTTAIITHVTDTHARAM